METGISIIFAGLVFLLIGIIVRVLHNSRVNDSKYVKTISKCVRYEERFIKDDDGYNNRYYYPVYEYVVNNRKFFLVGSYGSKSKDDLGKEAILYYNSNYPEDAFLENDPLSKYFILFGSIIMFIGIILLIAL